MVGEGQSLPLEDPLKPGEERRSGLFDDVLLEVAELPGVIHALDDDAAGNGNGHAKRAQSVAQRSVPRHETITDVAVYRDPQDVRTIFSLTRIVLVLSLLIVALVTANIYQYLRRPDRIVVDGSSGRVLSINDRNYGKEENVEFGPDRLTKEDKVYATKEFVKALYLVDPATRPRDIERALRMMPPGAAQDFANWMKNNRILDQQQEESWQTKWTPVDIALDQNDPYTVTVIGNQEITKVVSGVVQNETKQLRIIVKLVADSKGRSDRNLRTGFLVGRFEAVELTSTKPQTAAPKTSLLQ